jgi:23S rRNA (adenine-N6)-dimethyltransferase
VDGGRRTPRDERRRSLGQNFLLRGRAERFVEEIGIDLDDLVLEIGAGAGAITSELLRRGAEVIAVEVDEIWAKRLRTITKSVSSGRVDVVNADFLSIGMPARRFRVVGCIPFGQTTAILRRLLDDPRLPLLRADLIVQVEVARKRAAVPPRTLLSTVWAPWWEVRVGRRIPADQFRPVPRVDAAVLTVTRRDPPLLPPAMAEPFAGFVRGRWPFPAS